MNSRCVIRLQKLKSQLAILINNLWHTADSWGWMTWDPVEQKGGEPLLEQDRGASEEMTKMTIASLSRPDSQNKMAFC